ncbi:hypothetical protein C8Q76DRAFT_311544 [Earliella scabrosa]|nr:hypothetical protein C8Q76DRAFT_311544 [Earliella scabrosa]
MTSRRNLVSDRRVRHYCSSSHRAVILPNELAIIPTELWLEIFSQIHDQDSLRQAMLVSHFFSNIAEPALYRNVRIKSDAALVNFTRSLLSSSQRFAFVRELRIMHIEGMDPRILCCLDAILPPLYKLEHLTLAFPDHHYDSGEDMQLSQTLLRAPLPALSTFTTNLRPEIGADLIAAHPNLVELHITSTLHPYRATWSTQLSGVKLPYLCTMSCRQPVLSHPFPVPPRLTRLFLISCHSLAHLPHDLCVRLVSLRLGLDPREASEAEPQPMLLDEVSERFPSLRYLQLDMRHTPKPYLSTRLIDWSIPPDTSVPITPSPSRITLAWIFTRPKFADENLNTILGWHQFLRDEARRVLHWLEWGHYVERIICRHTVIPYISLSPSKDGTGAVVRERDIEQAMSDDHWKHVVG